MVTDISSIRKFDQPLGAVLWFFIIFKSLGILINIWSIVFLLFWVVPDAASLPSAHAFMLVIMIDGILPFLEIVATGLGIRLIVRRHRNMRKFWITFLLLYCLVQIIESQVSMGIKGTIFFFLTGFAWLVYWIIAKRPRELQLSSFWNIPKGMDSHQTSAPS
jgi:phage-related holin